MKILMIVVSSFRGNLSNITSSKNTYGIGSFFYKLVFKQKLR